MNNEMKVIFAKNVAKYRVERFMARKWKRERIEECNDELDRIGTTDKAYYTELVTEVEQQEKAFENASEITAAKIAAVRQVAREAGLLDADFEKMADAFYAEQKQQALEDSKKVVNIFRR